QSASVDEKTAPGIFEPAKTWFSDSQNIICLNSYPNGITLSFHSNDIKEPQPNKASDANEAGAGDAAGHSSARRPLAEHFALRLKDTRDYQVAQGKFFVHKQEAKN